MSARPKGVHEWAFALLLRLYPRWFRDGWGAEMREFFRARLARARRERAVTALWLSVLGDFFASLANVRRRRSENHRRNPVSMFLKDVRHASRQLWRAPLFTLGAVALLGIGLGVNIVAFTVTDALLLRPPPFDRPEEVVFIYQDSDDGEPSSSAFPAYRDMARADVFEAVAATSTASASWERPDGPVEVTIEYTTASYLAVLGLGVSRGRWFLPEEEIVGNAPVAVVSAAAWRSRMGADPSVVGSTIRLNGHPVTIVGIGPERLSGTFAPVVTDFWLSISATPVGGPSRVGNLDRREDHWYDVRARLAPGVTLQQAQSAMNALAAALGETHPDIDRGRGITVFRSTDVRFRPGYDATALSAAALLSAIVVTLLLLACANVANLLLARGIGRSGEMAVRRALGASTGTIVRLHLLEALLLSVTGGVAGIVLARWALSALDSLPLPFPLSADLDLPLDWRVASFAVALTILTGVLSGLGPALRSGRQGVAAALRDDRRTSPTGRGTTRLRHALVAVQVGASLILVLAAGLLARSLEALQNIDTGVDVDRVAWLRTSLSQDGLAPAQAAVVLDEIRSRIEALPGVTHAALASRLPAQRSGTTTTIVEGYTPASGTGAVELSFTVVTPEYFPAMGLRLLDGRVFAAGDDADADRVVIINEAAARAFWGSVNPVGRRLRSQSQPDLVRTVAGVVDNAPVGSLTEPVPPMFYVPLAQSGLSSAYVIARTDGAPEALLSAMRDELHRFRPSLPILTQGTLASHFRDALASPRFAARLMGAVSLLAMLLAGMGTYAVVSFGVARRAGELGIRMALGAAEGRVVRMVVGETARTVALGLFVGMAAAVVLAPRVEFILFGVAPLDPPTFAGAVLLLAAVGALAAWIPARRAARTDPGRSLRAL